MAARTGAAAAVCCLLLAGCGGETETGEVDFRVPVEVEEVAAGTVEDRIVATGTLRAAEVVTLTTETPGVLEIARGPSGGRLQEGDRVVAGQTVAEITGEDARLAARSEATRRRYESALQDLEAARELYEKGLTTETALRQAETTLEDARLEYDRSRRIEQRNRLTTPIDGVILELARDLSGRPLASGQLVQPGLVVARVASTGELVAEVDVVGADVARVQVGQEARIRHHAYPDDPFPGRVIRLGPAVDPATRALRVDVAVVNRDGRLRPGMFVEATLLAERREDVPVIPRSAVARRGERPVVFVLGGQRVSEREVVLGFGDDDTVEVRSGLEVGERVVVRGIETLTDRTAVRVVG